MFLGKCLPYNPVQSNSMNKQKQSGMMTISLLVNLLRISHPQGVLSVLISGSPLHDETARILVHPRRPFYRSGFRVDCRQSVGYQVVTSAGSSTATRKIDSSRRAMGCRSAESR